MSDETKAAKADRSESERAQGTPDDGEYHYAHADIREREGRIPLWLVLVVFGLLAWSVYYTIVYWSAS